MLIRVMLPRVLQNTVRTCASCWKMLMDRREHMCVCLRFFQPTPHLFTHANTPPSLQQTASRGSGGSKGKVPRSHAEKVRMQNADNNRNGGNNGRNNGNNARNNGRNSNNNARNNNGGKPATKKPVAEKPKTAEELEAEMDDYWSKSKDPKIAGAKMDDDMDSYWASKGEKSEEAAAKEAVEGEKKEEESAEAAE